MQKNLFILFGSCLVFMLAVGCASDDHATGSDEPIIAQTDDASDWTWADPVNWFKGGPKISELHTVDGAWAPRAVALRIMPSTRLVVEEDQPMLDATVELLDQMGDPVKAAGTFYFELVEKSLLGATTPRRLYAWDIEVLTKEQQGMFYNPVMRGYTFRLGLDDMDIGGIQSMLRVRFELVDGRRLIHEQAVEE